MSNLFVNVDNVNVSIENSSMINVVEWSKNGSSGKNPKGDLVVTFYNGERYEYIGVPSIIVQDMLISESIGKFFRENIKDKYVTYKYEGEDI